LDAQAWTWPNREISMWKSVSTSTQSHSLTTTQTHRPPAPISASTSSSCTVLRSKSSWGTHSSIRRLSGKERRTRISKWLRSWWTGRSQGKPRTHSPSNECNTRMSLSRARASSQWPSPCGTRCHCWSTGRRRVSRSPGEASPGRAGERRRGTPGKKGMAVRWHIVWGNGPASAGRAPRAPVVSHATPCNSRQ